MYDEDYGRQRRIETPMRIYPAPHYTMGGLWVDYNLMSNHSRASSSLGECELLGPRRQPPRRVVR